jgi:SPP1 gp7 family putative phage head morphogenesis protein
MAKDQGTAAAGTDPKVPGPLGRVVQGLKYIISGVTPSTWFGPMQPILPSAQEAAGRLWDYPVGLNIRISPQQGEKGVELWQLRALADSCDLLRAVIEPRKDQMAKVEFNIVPRDPKNTSAAVKKRCAQVEEFLAWPDKAHDWETWLKALLEDVLVIDAPAILPRYTRGGKLYGLEILDGGTINKLIDEHGRTPLPPSPAYQQILKGLPVVDYTRDQVVYKPRNVRSWRNYGFSPVEQVIMITSIALNRTVFQFNYYREGTIPDAFAGVPKDWTPQQIAEFQVYWDALLEGNLAQRRKLKFVPTETASIHETKLAPLKDEFDEWLARVICFVFSISPAPFVKVMNRATSENLKQSALEEGLAPMLNWVKGLMNLLIGKYLEEPELIFDWKMEGDIDPLAAAQVAEIHVRNGIRSVDEVREDMGADPIGLGNAIFTAQGAILLKDILAQSEAQAQAGAEPGGGNGGGEEKTPEELQEIKEALHKVGLDDLLKLDREALLQLAKAQVRPINRDRPRIKALRQKLAELLRRTFRKWARGAARNAINAYEKIAKAEDEDVQKILQAIDTRGWAVIWDDMAPLLTAITKEGVAQAFLQIGFSPEAEMAAEANDLAVNWAKSWVAGLVGKIWQDGKLVDNPDQKYSIPKATREMLRPDVAQALEEGWSSARLADAIRDSYGFSEARAEMIARTETTRADIHGNLLAWRQSGVVEKRQWVVSGKENMCDECEGLDGTEADIDDDFPDGDPPLHPNCDCTVVAVVGGKE